MDRHIEASESGKRIETEEVMKIKNWIHAIDLAIQRHQAVLDGKYLDYKVANKNIPADPEKTLRVMTIILADEY